MQNRYNAGVSAIEESALAKHDKTNQKDSRKAQEKTREAYVKWHIAKYGRPPNPNFFRGVSESGSEKSHSASPRAGSAKGRRGTGATHAPGGLNAIKMANMNNEHRLK